MITLQLEHGKLSIIDLPTQQKIGIQIDEYPYYEQKEFLLEKIILFHNTSCICMIKSIEEISSILEEMSSFLKEKISWLDPTDFEYAAIQEEQFILEMMKRCLFKEISWLKEQNQLLHGYNTLDTITKTPKYLTTLKYWPKEKN